MGVDLYPQIIHEGSLSPESSGAEIDEICKEIHESGKGFGTDEQRLSKSLGGCSPEERCKVAMRYKVLYAKDLKSVLAIECAVGDFGTAIGYLAVDPVHAECDMIAKACRGVGTNERLLLTILCGRTNKEMSLLKKKFFEVYDEDLGNYVDAELSGKLESLFYNLLQGDEEIYDPAIYNDDKMIEDINEIYEMGEDKLKAHAKRFFKIICAAPSEYLQKLNLMYETKHGCALEKLIAMDQKTEIEKATSLLFGMKLKPYEEIAKLIKEACRGFGTNETLLTCCLIRYQQILKHVMPVHKDLFGKTVRDRVNSEAGGDYRKILLEIIETSEIL